jgi:hypothetical protein
MSSPSQKPADKKAKFLLDGGDIDIPGL